MADTTLSTATTVAVEKKSLKDKATHFFSEVSKEIKKVTWPSREQLIDATIVTLVLVVVTSIFIFGVDKIFEVVLRLVYAI